MADRSARAATAAALAFALCWVGGLAPAGASIDGARFNRHVTLEGNGLGSVRIGTSEGTGRGSSRPSSGSRPTAASGCTGPFRNVEWHDPIVQFTNGRFTGYRYWLPQPHAALDPRLKTQRGITLGNTFGRCGARTPSRRRAPTSGAREV